MIRRIRRHDRGSAVVEFVIVAVCVLVPLTYVVVSIATVQSAMFATSQAVREAGRAFSGAASEAGGRAAAVAAARLAFADQGLAMPADGLAVSCLSGACLEPGSVVQVDIEWDMPLPWLPESLGSRASVPISATHRLPIDEYRSNQVDQ